MYAVEFETKIDRNLIYIPQEYQFKNDNVKVIILKNDDKDKFDVIENIGKIGFNSQSFIDDDEDYSKW